MIREYYEKICAGEQVRENLIALRDALKNESEKRAFAYLVGGSFDVLCGLLSDADPKVRRNAALILGMMESEDLLPVLFDTYEKEETLFVRADYLRAIANMDCRPLLGRLQAHLDQLRSREVSAEEEKHISAEIRELQRIVMQYQKHRPHHFLGEEVQTDVILVTNRCQREATARQIQEGNITLLAGGIRVEQAHLDQILPIRTWSELLFPLQTPPLPPQKPDRIGSLLADRVLTRLEELHRGSQPYLFRIELRTRMPQEKKGAYIRRLSDALERASGGMLINSTSEYEVEIRLLERRDGTLVPMLRLYTIPEKRFAYRRESVASSIAPVNAALTVELARPYLKEEAQVLDPFCGVGTMLMERNYAVHAGTMYGIDLYGDAIEKARINTAYAGCRIHYINKDFFAFHHEYLFDEIITDMPQVTASRPAGEIRDLYLRFFVCAGDCLKDEAILVLYATEPDFVLQGVRRNPEYRILRRHEINEKNHTTVFVIRRTATCGTNTEKNEKIYR